jgi:hypothetical protein
MVVLLIVVAVVDDVDEAEHVVVERDNRAIAQQRSILTIQDPIPRAVLIVRAVTKILRDVRPRRLFADGMDRDPVRGAVYNEGDGAAFVDSDLFGIEEMGECSSCLWLRLCELNGRILNRRCLEIVFLVAVLGADGCSERRADISTTMAVTNRPFMCALPCFAWMARYAPSSQVR